MKDKRETADEFVEAGAEAPDESDESAAPSDARAAEPALTGYQPEAAEDQAGKRRRFLLILVIIIVSFLVGAGGVGYFGWLQIESLKTAFANAESTTGDQVEGLAQGQEVARKSLVSDVDQRMEQMNARLLDFNSTVDSLSSLVVEATQSDPDGLVIAEVDYLLQLANYRIGLERNRDAALLAISRAQSRLGSLDSGAYRPILDQIAEDKAALESVVTPDIGAVVDTLLALLARVDELGAGAEKIAPQGESPEPEERQDSGWKAFMSAFGENLSQFVEIQKADGAAAPTLIPDQEYFARENVRISLHNARASVVRRDVENFSLSLAEARFWLEGHFASSAPTPYMQGELERLGGLELNPILPNLDASLVLVRKLSQTPPKSQSFSPEVVPEVVAPEAQAPEAQASEAQAPEAQAPEAQAPEAQAPEAQAPEGADKTASQMVEEVLEQVSEEVHEATGEAIQ